GEGEGDFVPDVTGAGDLLEESGRLEEHRVGEDDDAAGGAETVGAAQLHDVEAKESGLDDVAGDAADGDADAVAPDEEEVGDAGEDDGLEGDGDAGGEDAGEGGQRGDFGDEAEDQDQQNDAADDHAADEEELSAA